MINTHTAGPWRVGLPDGGGLADRTTGHGAWIIGPNEEIVVTGGRHYGVMSPADAALISIAPDLLALVRSIMLAHCGQCPSEVAAIYTEGCACPQCREGRRIIARMAEGEVH